MSRGAGWWVSVTTGVQPAVTETGAPHVGSHGEGCPHLALHALITGWAVGPLLSSQSAMLGTRLMPGLVDSPVSPCGLMPCLLGVAAAPPACF